MRDHLFLLPLAILVSPLLCQLKFGGGVSSSSSNSNSNSPNRNTRMSLTQDSLAASLVGNSHTVATAVTLSPSTTTTTTGPTATFRTRASTTRTRASAARTPGGASATTASPSAMRTETHMGLARGGTARVGPGATPLVGTTTAATFRVPTDSKTTPGPTGRAAIKDDEESFGAAVFKQ